MLCVRNMTCTQTYTSTTKSTGYLRETGAFIVLFLLYSLFILIHSLVGTLEDKVERHIRR